ncbi:MAG: hypothetical protein ACOCU4_10325, partial [Alkalispirochaeta sp.]
MQSTLDNLREFIHDLNDEQLYHMVMDMPIHEIVALWEDLDDGEAINLFVLLPIDKKAELIT